MTVVGLDPDLDSNPGFEAGFESGAEFETYCRPDPDPKQKFRIRNMAPRVPGWDLNREPTRYLAAGRRATSELRYNPTTKPYNDTTLSELCYTSSSYATPLFDLRHTPGPGP